MPVSGEPTLLDIAKHVGNDMAVGLLESVTTFAPEMERLPARTIRGTSYSTVLRKSYPAVGFRNANAAATKGASDYENKLVQCYILSALLQADKAVAKAYPDGPEAWMALESAGALEQALIEVGSQVYYGTTVDTAGFPGLQEIVDSTMTIDAGGTTADTGSSVYAVRAGIQDVHLVFGNDTTLDISDVREETLSSIPSFVADLTSWVGLQSVRTSSVGRLKDATEDSGKGVTDDLIAQLVEKFPVGRPPTVLFMTRRSRRQLQVSRSAVTAQNAGPGGAPAWAPIPTESNGIPIQVTDSLTNTEALS